MAYDPYEDDPAWFSDDPGLIDWVLERPGRHQLAFASLGGAE